MGWGLDLAEGRVSHVWGEGRTSDSRPTRAVFLTLLKEMEESIPFRELLTRNARNLCIGASISEGKMRFRYAQGCRQESATHHCGLSCSFGA